MSVKVRFMTNVWELGGKEEMDLEVDVDAVPPPTARDLIKAVAESQNRDLSSLLRRSADGSSWSAIRVVRNGRVLPSLDVEVADGDVLVLVPLLGAG